MTSVTQSDNNSQTNWRWPAVGLGKCAMRQLEQALQRKLDKKAAGRDACCGNEELMSDFWFEGFPELIERKQVMLAVYTKRDASEEPDVLKRKSRVAQPFIKLHPRKNKLQTRRRNANSTGPIKIAA